MLIYVSGWNKKRIRFSFSLYLEWRHLDLWTGRIFCQLQQMSQQKDEWSHNAEQRPTRNMASKLKRSDGDIIHKTASTTERRKKHLITYAQTHIHAKWWESLSQPHVSNNANVECARMLDNFMMAIEKVCIYRTTLSWKMEVLTISNATISPEEVAAMARRSIGNS